MVFIDPYEHGKKNDDRAKQVEEFQKGEDFERGYSTHWGEV